TYFPFSRNERTLFDQKSMIQRQKPRNNASTFRLLMILVFFVQITPLRSVYLPRFGVIAEIASTFPQLMLVTITWYFFSKSGKE
ncbi:hypothetical protein, partial [Paenibacillus alginolyticus]|uniref:hypothetical protein n=1 Tax=Paenibacillus alginolyticus TaxID=59839 RepID=UPI001C3FC1E8